MTDDIAISIVWHVVWVVMVVFAVGLVVEITKPSGLSMLLPSLPKKKRKGNR